MLHRHNSQSSITIVSHQNHWLKPNRLSISHTSRWHWKYARYFGTFRSCFPRIFYDGIRSGFVHVFVGCVHARNSSRSSTKQIYSTATLDFVCRFGAQQWKRWVFMLNHCRVWHHIQITPHHKRCITLTRTPNALNEIAHKLAGAKSQNLAFEIQLFRPCSVDGPKEWCVQPFYIGQIVRWKNQKSTHITRKIFPPPLKSAWIKHVLWLY